MDSQASVQSTGPEQGHEFALGDELRGERATKGKTLLDVQRDLRIQAAYISAIEDGDIKAFPNPSFIPGYIRSYSRYLGLDPDEVYRRFCSEYGFNRDAAAAAKRPAPEARKAAAKTGAGDPPLHSFQPRFPLVEPKPNVFASIEVSAVGSLLVLIALVAGLGYGGWIVLQNIQRVQFAPVEDLPLAVAEVAPLEAPNPNGATEPDFAELAKPVAATALTDLYRQQELEVPILAPRDGPIAAIDPEDAAPLKPHMVQEIVRKAVEQAAAESTAATLTEAALSAGEVDLPTVSEAALLPMTILVERAAWIRVYLETGTVIFERILEKGESYTPPEGVGAPRIWAGNSGSVYVRLGEDLHGPLGSGTRAVRDVVLDPATIGENYDLVEEIPEVISQTIAIPRPGSPEAVAIR
jgi:cytoskeletal protein RodZ